MNPARLLSWFLACAFLTASAQAHEGPQRIAVADGIYLFMTPDYGDVGHDGNAIAILSDDGVLVFDSNGTPAAARAVIAGIRELTSQPVRFLVNSHWHWDHWYGSEAYRAAFPGISIIAHEKTRTLMAGPAVEFNRPGLAEQLPAYLASLAQRIDQQRAAGAPAGDVKRLEARLAEDTAYLDAKRSVHFTLPDVTFEDELDIHLGSRLVRIRNAGPAVTPGDAFLYLPEERILVTGDLLVNPISWALSCYPTGWVKTLELLDSLDARVIVPGHGPPLEDESLLHATIAVFRILLDRGRASHAAGIDVDAARAAILPDLDAQRRVITGGDPQLDPAFDIQLVDWFLHRVYDEAAGPLDDTIAPIPST